MPRERRKDFDERTIERLSVHPDYDGPKKK